MPMTPRCAKAAIKAATYLAKSYSDGYVPPVVLNWNDADDNNAFHAKLPVMDFDGSLSTELAHLPRQGGVRRRRSYGPAARQ